MTEYWLISAPGDKTCQQTWESMNNITNKQNSLSVNYKFHIPDLKVGTLDQLVGLSDDLGKLDGFVEQVTRKVAAYLGEVLEDQRDKLHENLMANNNSDGPDGDGKTKIDPEDTDDFDAFIPSKRRLSKKKSSSSTTTNKSTPDASPSSSSCKPTLYDGCSGSDNNNPCPLRCSHHDERGRPRSDCHRQDSTESSSSPVSCCSVGHRHRRSSSPPFGQRSSPPTATVDSSPASGATPCAECCGDIDNYSPQQPSTPLQPSSLKFPMAPGDLPTYITRFQWDMAKYPIKQSLRNIADIISKQVGQIDADLKTKSTAYNNLKGNLQSLEKKQTGSLLTRNLADLVKKEHFILDSEYLTTLLVIVPKPLANDWNHHYEKLTDMIVPRSSQLIIQDHDYGLYTVSLFKKVVDEFKLHAREKKFIVRDFTYNEEELAAGKNEITKLVTDKKKQFGPLVRWLKVNFSECFCAWIHVKALRVFVESVLRYGLPVNFQAILIHPNKKNTKRLRDVLNQLYGHLDSSALSGSGQSDAMDIPGLGFGQSDYYPYVYYKINIDMLDSKV